MMVIAACACAIVFGIGPFMFRRVLQEIPVSQMLVLVSTMFCVASLLYWLYITGGKWECMADSTLSLGVLAGIFVFFVGYYLFLTALCDPGANTVIISAITHTSVAITLIISYFVFRETLTLTQLFGICLIIAGCLLTSI